MNDLRGIAADPRPGQSSLETGRTNYDTTASLSPLAWNNVAEYLNNLADEIWDSDSVMAIWPKLCDLTRDMEKRVSKANFLSIIRNHKIAQIAWQDPFTFWSYTKPRGYSGDARLIDFIYGHSATHAALKSSTPIGRSVFSFTYGAETCVAVRERRRLLAHYIDETVERVGAPDILAVASGHLREVELAHNIQKVRRLVALDQDKESLAEISSSYPDLGCIEKVQMRVNRFIVQPTAYGQFDLIYAAGLYDYLNERTAMRLTAGLFQALKPGGRLLFGNFSTGIREEGYMATLMDWRLVLRSDADLQKMLDQLPVEQVQRARVFRGNNGAIIYASVIRA
jgi:hypothetical protein